MHRRLLGRGAVERCGESCAELEHRGVVRLLGAVHGALPCAHQARGVLISVLRDRFQGGSPGEEGKTIAFRARLADRYAVIVHEPGEQSPVEQRERGPMLALLPELACGSPDVRRQALGTDIQIADVARRRWGRGGRRCRRLRGGRSRGR